MSKGCFDLFAATWCQKKMLISHYYEMMQILPFCSEETLAKIEGNILKMRPVSDAPSDCKASDIVEAILDGIGVGDYNNAVSTLFYHLDDLQRSHAIAGEMTPMLENLRRPESGSCSVQ